MDYSNLLVIYMYINAYVRIENTSLHKMSTRSMFRPRVEEAEIRRQLAGVEIYRSDRTLLCSRVGDAV